MHVDASLHLSLFYLFTSLGAKQVPGKCSDQPLRTTDTVIKTRVKQYTSMEVCIL